MKKKTQTDAGSKNKKQQQKRQKMLDETVMDSDTIAYIFHIVATMSFRFRAILQIYITTNE